MHRLIGAERDPKAVPVGGQVHAAADLRLRPIHMIMDERIGERERDDNREREKAERGADRADRKGPERMQAGMGQAAGMAVAALVANLPIALKDKVEQRMFELQSGEKHQKNDGIGGHEARLLTGKRCRRDEYAGHHA